MISGRAPILVSGAHRSGTTWVGKILASNPETAYISEPLNIHHRPGVFGAATSHWYTYICDENEDTFLTAYRKLMGLKYDWLAEVGSLRSRKDLLRMGRDGSAFLLGRMRRARPLIKDPFAIFSLEWFSQRLGCLPVVTIRHPAAVVSSMKRLNWPFDFNDLLQQPLLMRDWLEPYRDEMEQLRSKPEDIIAQGSLLWRMIYATASVYRNNLPSLQIVRHEDLSTDPVGGFRSLYAALELTFTRQVEQAVLGSSGSENPSEVSRDSIYSTRLDSRANITNWKKRLALDEIERIRRLTEDVAAQFYGEEDW